jgi:hypothetical protein
MDMPSTSKRSIHLLYVVLVNLPYRRGGIRVVIWRLDIEETTNDNVDYDTGV